jgi:Gpi18-like mannosyltransferase
MHLKLSDKIKKIKPDYISIYDVFFYFFVVILCFLLFQQGDLFHTSSSSYAYLNGHIIDFYDYNKKVVSVNDYLPIIYVVFAVWNIPLKILGVAHDVAASGITLGIVELIWTKLLIVVFYFLTTFTIYLISKAISGQSNKAKYIAIIFATSPIAIFAAFIFGQYDIIETFFTMLGFYYYIKRDYMRFSIFFSIAISAKFFPLIIFIPLLLLAEKRIIYIFKYIIISLLSTILQMALYYNNLAFRNNILVLATGKTSSMAELVLSPVNSSPYFIILFVIICVYAYIKDVDQVGENYRTAVFISVISYAVMFSTVLWHPQWLIIVMPFFALSCCFISDVKKMFLIDLVGMLSYVYIISNNWPYNVDANMLGKGILRSFFSYIPLSNSQLFIPNFFHIFMGVFFVYLFSPLLIQAFQKGNIKILGAEENFFTANNYLRSRFFIGLAIFVVPSLFCALAPKRIARKIDPSAYTISGLAITQSEKPVGVINKNKSIKQSFIAEYDNLNSVNVQLATWARINDCEVLITLLDENSKLVVSQKIDGKTIVDNAFYKFGFKPIAHSKGKLFYIEIETNATNGNGITAWQSSKDVYHFGKLYINKKEVDGDLCIKLFYDI